ncbi:MAG TPA: hypothetical protein VGB42_02855 [Candidatus Thermoplasmatota archaeon]
MGIARDARRRGDRWPGAENVETVMKTLDITKITSVMKTMNVPSGS